MRRRSPFAVPGHGATPGRARVSTAGGSGDPSGRDGARHVLLWMPRGGRVQGGHVVQLEKTARALRAVGLHITTEMSPEPALDGIDLVHGFGLRASEIRHCHTRRVPVALSTIYWDRSYRADGGGGRPGARTWAGRGWRAATFTRAALGGRGALIEECRNATADETAMYAAFESADLLLPNAEGEGDAVRHDFGVSTPTHVVPNGVDPEAFTDSSLPFEDRGYVLFVGRMEPHKNQLGLIEALRGSGLPLVIAGHGHPDHPKYAEQCHRAGAGWVEFSGTVPDEAGLARLYRGARVHVLPSWFETTGLVSLEAALSGCSVVSTSRGHAREYLGDDAWYCDPGSPPSILEAVRHGWEQPPPASLRDRVLARFTWAHVAEATLAAYDSVLGRPADAH
jgi:glycosyltransferase involved in cell wall biosynthesis